MDDDVAVGLADTVRALALRHIPDDAGLIDSLQWVASAGCGLLAGCRGASVTVIVAGRPVTMASTGERAVALDDAQYEVNDGPCLTAGASDR